MGLGKAPFMMKISLSRRAHPKWDQSPSTGPALQRIQPSSERTRSLRRTVFPRPLRTARPGSALFQEQLRRTEASSRLTSLLRLSAVLCSAPPRPALPSPGRRWRQDTKRCLRLPSEVSPQPSWLRPLWRGRKSSVSQATRQTEVACLEKRGGACAGKAVGRGAGAFVTQRLRPTRVFIQLEKG